MNFLVKEYVDIYKRPAIHPTDKFRDVTVGDLHANAIKFLFSLCYHGIIEISEKHYATLVNIYLDVYHKPKQKHKKFKEIMSSIKILNRSFPIRLIGDELCDRGKNDYFILLLLMKLFVEGANIEILLSNHGFDFLRAFENLVINNNRFDNFIISPTQTTSLSSLQRLIDTKEVKLTEIIEIVKTAYIPSLKLISYTLDEVGNRITIRSHALIDLNNINMLADKYNIIFKDETLRDLANTIDLINIAFQEDLASGTFTNKVNIADLKNALANNSSDPILNLIWNREHLNLMRDEQYKSYLISYVHGHSYDNTFADLKIFNLENDLGKLIDENCGFYTYLVSADISPSMIKEFASGLSNNPIITDGGVIINDKDSALTSLSEEALYTILTLLPIKDVLKMSRLNHSWAKLIVNHPSIWKFFNNKYLDNDIAVVEKDETQEIVKYQKLSFNSFWHDRFKSKYFENYPAYNCDGSYLHLLITENDVNSLAYFFDFDADTDSENSDSENSDSENSHIEKYFEPLFWRNLRKQTNLELASKKQNQSMLNCIYEFFEALNEDVEPTGAINSKDIDVDHLTGFFSSADCTHFFKYECNINIQVFLAKLVCNQEESIIRTISGMSWNSSFERLELFSKLLSLFAFYGNRECLSQLLKQASEIDKAIIFSKPKNPLYYAIKSNNLSTALSLINAGAKIDSKYYQLAKLESARSINKDGDLIYKYLQGNNSIKDNPESDKITLLRM